MTNLRVRRGRALALACLTAGLLVHGEASAASTPASCKSDAVTVQVAGNSVLDPITAGNDKAACQSAVAGLPNTTQAVALDKLINARTAYASTTGGTSATARAGVEGLQVTLGGQQLSIGAARSSLTASCASGRTVYQPASEVTRISLAGRPLVLDGVLQPVTSSLNNLLGAVVEVKLNEIVALPGGGRAVRAARVTLLRGAKPLGQVIVAQSRIGGNPCATSTGDPATPGTPVGAVCPNGSVYVVSRNLCVIPAPGTPTATNPLGDTTGPGAVVVGRPSSGQIGGSVLGLVEARRRFPRSPCVRGKGSPYIILGTKRGNRITGTNHGDRVISRGGRDRVDAGRGNDCVDAGKGRDFITGGQGHDRMFGGAKRDIVNGDGKSDRLHGGTGNDTLNAAYGADRVWGGRGNDKINVATAGRRATVWAGPGRDKVRGNPGDLGGIHGAEIVKITRALKKKH